MSVATARFLAVTRKRADLTQLADELAAAASAYSAWARHGYSSDETARHEHPLERLRGAVRRIDVEMRHGVVYGLWDPDTHGLRYVGVTTRAPLSRLAEHRRALHSAVGQWIAGLGRDPVMGTLVNAWGQDLYIAERDEIFKQTWAGHDLLNVDHDADHALFAWASKGADDFPDFSAWFEERVVVRESCPACLAQPWEDCRTHPHAASIPQGASHLRRCAAYLRRLRGKPPQAGLPQVLLNYREWSN